MNSLKSVSVNLLIPFIISLVFAIVVYNEAKIPRIIFSLVPYIFYAISGLILWVSWHFNRNRFIFIVIPLILMHIGFEHFSATHATSLFLYISILFPLHLIIFLVLKREDCSRYGVFSR